MSTVRHTHIHVRGSAESCWATGWSQIVTRSVLKGQFSLRGLELTSSSTTSTLQEWRWKVIPSRRCKVSHVWGSKSTLSWHLRYLCALPRAASIISVRQALSVDNDIMLVYAFISTRIDYCNSVFHHFADVHLRPFQSVPNAASCLIVRQRKSDSITATLRDDLHWLPVRAVPQRIHYKLRLLVYKGLHHMPPSYLPMICVPVLSDPARRPLRSAAKGDLHAHQNYRLRST